jgi:TP901 family phage tail tape measure protein
MALYDVSARLVLESVDSSSVQRAVSSVNTRLERGTKSAKAFYDAASLKGINLAGYAALGGAMAKIGMVVASATHDAIRFDQELAKLAQTVGVSNKDIKEHSESIRKMSVAYGLSAPKIAETIRVLAQAGYSLNEAKAAADNLAQTTLLASFESISNTTEGLIAINKQFTETVGQSARVLSLLNVVAKKYAVESDDLVDAAKRAGGVFAATGGSLEELVTIYTTVRDTTRESSETISTGLRTIFSRLQRPKTIDYLRQFGIELTDLKGNFIGNYEAIIEIQKGIQRANIQPGSLQFSAIVEQLGGVLQQSRVIPLLTQAAKMQRIYADAQNASSETAADLAKAQETLSFKLAQTQQNFAKLIGDVMETSSFKAMISTVLSLTNAFIGFAGSIKELIPLLATFAAIKLSKSLLGVGLPSFGRGKAPIKRASGGFVPGSGSGDTVPAMLEPGEFVIRKSAAQAMGAEALHGINKYGFGGTVEKLSDSYKSIKTLKGFKDSSGNISALAKRKMNYTADFKKVIPNQKDIELFHKLSGPYGKRFEQVLSKSRRFKTGRPSTNPYAYVDFPYSPGGASEAKFMKEGTTYSDDDNIKGATHAGIAAKALLLSASNNANRRIRGMEIRQKDLSPKSITTYVTDPDLWTMKRKKKVGIRRATGGGISGTDTVPALLTPGEFVVNKESAQAFGYGNLEKVNKYASGGYVGVQKFATGSRGRGVKPDVFTPPTIHSWDEFDQEVNPPQAKPRGGKKASDAVRTGAFSGSGDLDDETKRVKTSFSDLAFVAAGVASQYTDSESAMSRAIGTTLEFVSTAALAVSALELFGVSLNAKSISSFLSGGFKGIATKASKLLATNVGGSSIASASTVSSMSALGGAVVATTAAMAAAGLSVYAFGSIVDSARGLTEATNKAIMEGNAAKAAEAATYEKSQSDATVLSASFTALVAGIGLAVAGLAAWPVVLGAAIVGVVAKLVLMTDVGAGLATGIRDLGASFGLLESSASIAAKASFKASLQNAKNVSDRNSTALSKQVAKANNKEKADNVLRGGVVRENAAAIGAADRDARKSAKEKQDQQTQNSQTGYFGQVLDSFTQMVGGESINDTNVRLSKEMEDDRQAVKDQAKSNFDQIAPLVDTSMSAFTDFGGTDWDAFLISIGPAAAEMMMLAGITGDMRLQFEDSIEAAKTEAALRAILSEQLVKQLATTTGLAEANRKGIAASQLGSTIAGLSSSGFRSSSLSTNASSSDVNRQIAAAKSLGVTGYDENLSAVNRSKSELEKLNQQFATATPEKRKELSEKILQNKRDTIEAAGGSADGLDADAINAAYEATIAGADELQSKLIEAATNVETGINRFIDALDAANKAQMEYAAASDEAGRSARGRDADLQSFRSGGSTISEIRARQDETRSLIPANDTRAEYGFTAEMLNRKGKRIVAQETSDPLNTAVGAKAARDNKIRREATVAGVPATAVNGAGGGALRGGAAAAGAARPVVGPNAAPGAASDAAAAANAVAQDSIGLQFQFSALQVAAEKQAAAINRETGLREANIEAIKEELSLEKDRAQTIEEFNIALSGGAGTDAKRDAQKKLRSLQRVENARLTGGEAAANKEIGRAINRNGGDRSFYTGIQAPETAQNLQRDASATGGKIGLRRLGQNSELGQNLNMVGQTGFTANGSNLAGQVGAQNTEINANDAALVEGMRLHSEMLSSSAAMFNQSIMSMTGGLGKFSEDMRTILDGLKGASFDLKMQGGNVSVDISDKSGVIGMVSDAAKREISDMIAEAIRGKEMGAL